MFGGDALGLVVSLVVCAVCPRVLLPSMVSWDAAALVFLPDEAPLKVAVVPLLGVPRTSMTEFARKELFLETKGGELGEAAGGVTRLASDSVLFFHIFLLGVKHSACFCDVRWGYRFGSARW